MNILELYSGIGGMHLAFKQSGIAGKVNASIEINNIANQIYRLNFPKTNLINTNIEGLTSDYIKKLNVDTILMSPPCQPFTRNGLQNDIKDARTASFFRILKLLPDLDIKYLLIENVKGFENSEMRNILIDVLIENDYKYQEFIISPHQIGVPNSRHRYYCLAKKTDFSFETTCLMETFPNIHEHIDCYKIENIIEQNVDFKKYYLSDQILTKYWSVLDICYKNSTRSCCFTKSYGRFVHGTGSVFTEKSEEVILKLVKELNSSNLEEHEKLGLLKSLGLRFFTPREICRLMCFPENFIFPDYVRDRKKYMVLGNSINVKVVAELIKILNC
ncbi:tRNA (cytosine(38)-C(5))-methyltransferase [Diorhabda sublineata]|uniref:tRNA (cytosine(38)-C(5))-methyltransferase n=1 Tax=Diorhabda sublineata TaxID=1163346 RepID=UPI0024E06E96|nr:tRNA (cytosine(38)-C(5))-methyltransferase [Diorhabda sublineata]